MGEWFDSLLGHQGQSHNSVFWSVSLSPVMGRDCTLIALLLPDDLPCERVTGRSKVFGPGVDVGTHREAGIGVAEPRGDDVGGYALVSEVLPAAWRLAS